MLEFTKIHTRKKMETLRWIINAKPKNYYSNLALEYLHVTEKHIESSDGHRLHQADNFGIEPGFYRVIKNNKSTVIIHRVNEDLTWPDSKEILDLVQNNDTTIPGCCEFLGAYAKTIRTIPETDSVVPDYVQDVFSNSHEFTIYADTRTSNPVFFINETCRAVVMPIKI